MVQIFPLLVHQIKNRISKTKNSVLIYCFKWNWPFRCVLRWRLKHIFEMLRLVCGDGDSFEPPFVRRADESRLKDEPRGRFDTPVRVREQSSSELSRRETLKLAAFLMLRSTGCGSRCAENENISCRRSISMLCALRCVCHWCEASWFLLCFKRNHRSRWNCCRFWDGINQYEHLSCRTDELFLKRPAGLRLCCSCESVCGDSLLLQLVKWLHISFSEPRKPSGNKRHLIKLRLNSGVCV